MEELLNQGANAFESGDIETARKLFAEAINRFPDEERAWEWMYDVCDNEAERTLCINQMVRINPQNKKAKDLKSEATRLDWSFEHSAAPKFDRTWFSQLFENAALPNNLKNNWIGLLLGLLLVFVLMVLVFVLLRGPGDKNEKITFNLPASSKQTYATEMIQPINLLKTYTSTLNQWDTLMATVMPGREQEQWTYAYILKIFPSYIKSGIKISSTDPFLKPLFNTVPPLARRISKDGSTLLASWSSIAPPFDIKNTHNKISTCIQYKIDNANDILTMLDKHIIPTRDVTTDPCVDYQKAVTDIQEYIKTNQ
jgi:hypothetical protein